MLNLFNLGRLTALTALISFSSAMAWDCCNPCEPQKESRFYVGAFGGQLYSNSPNVYQYGTAFFTEAEGGPLSVIGEGRLNKTQPGFGGVQVGYEMWKPSCSSYTLATAGELEAFFFCHKKSGNLINQTVNGLDEHNFADSFHADSSVILANVVLSIKTDSLFGLTPYFGGGIGAANVELTKADSFQIEPIEDGINHFNSNRSDASWAFAAQAKAGVRFNFCELFHIFAEYRYLYVDSTNYLFGATNYEGHVPTTPWNVKVKNTHFNAFAVGFQFDL